MTNGRELASTGEVTSGLDTEYPTGMMAAARAMVRHPEWSTTRVAETAGVSRTTMYTWRRDPRLLELVEMVKESPERGVDPIDAIGRMDDVELKSLEDTLERESVATGASELASLIDRLSRRIHDLEASTRRNAMTEVRKVTVRIARMDPDREFSGYDELGNPEPITMQDFLFGAQLSQSIVDTAKLVSSRLTDEHRRRVDLHSRLVRLFMYGAALLRHGLPIPEQTGSEI